MFLGVECFACIGTMTNNYEYKKKKKTNKNSANFISSKLSGCVIASCPTVVLASLDTFHTKCKPLILYAVILVKNSNIVTVFSTYINIICTRQQTGVSLSLAILAPPSPIIKHPIFLPLPLFHTLCPPCPYPLGKVRGGRDEGPS